MNNIIVDYKDNYLGKLHKVLNYKIEKYKLLYHYNLDKRNTHIKAIKDVKEFEKLYKTVNNKAIVNNLRIRYHELYQAKRGINFYQKKLRECKRMISKIHHNYATKGIDGIKKYKYLIIENYKHI